MSPQRHYSDPFARAFRSPFQHTLAAPIACEGIGLHNGLPVRMTLCPAPEGTGILFCRTDRGNKIIPASWEKMQDMQLCTALAEGDVAVATIEHLMAALWGSGIDNAIIKIDGPEVPAMDGSSAPFLREIAATGLQPQAARRRLLEIVQRVEVTDGKGGMLRLEPGEGFALDVTIDFEHPTIAHQHGQYDFSQQSFTETLGAARTFGFESDVKQMRRHGLARGGSLDNAVVVGDEGVLNPEGLRSPDEFVRHKALDCVGDLFVAGGRIRGKVTAERPGHALNKAVLHALFARPEAWRWVDAPLAEKKAPIAPKQAQLPATGNGVSAQAGYLK